MPLRKDKPIETAADPSAKAMTVEQGKSTCSYSINITKSIGQYETMKIGAHVTLPIDADAETLRKIDATLVIARDKVVERLSKDFDDILSKLV